jgi:microcystin-dependent protein
MGLPYVGEIKLVGFNFAPRNYAFAQGQILSISQNTALFSLLGVNFGGDGKSNFGLPDLRGRAAMFYGSQTVIGEQIGTEQVTVLSTQYPAHAHAFAVNTTGGLGLPTNNFLASVPGASHNIYAVGGTPQPLNSTGSPPALAVAAGGSQPHQNMQPFLVMNYIIALFGAFPARN